MEVKQILIIPNRQCLNKYIELAQKYNCGFEYNDFFLPDVLEQDSITEEIIRLYTAEKNLPQYTTLHGAFLDITVHSDDTLIRRASDIRINQSMDAAMKIGAKAVVFHTNAIPNFYNESYRQNWLDRNINYWTAKLEQYPELEIYIENMFDMDWELLAALGRGMEKHSRFGICLDYAHAHAFGNEKEIDEWVRALSPYVKHIHINDNDFKTDKHWRPGAGRIDWKLFAEYYKTYFSNASVLLEVSDYEDAKDSLDYIQNL